MLLATSVVEVPTESILIGFTDSVLRLPSVAVAVVFRSC